MSTFFVILGLILQSIGAYAVSWKVGSLIFRLRHGGRSMQEYAAMALVAGVLNRKSEEWLVRYRERAVSRGYQGHSAVILLGKVGGTGRGTFGQFLISGFDWEEFDGDTGERLIRGCAWRYKVQAYLDSGLQDINREAAPALRDYISDTIGIVCVDQGVDWISGREPNSNSGGVPAT